MAPFTLQQLVTEPVPKIASTDGDLAQWKSFVELGRKAGLRKAGFSEKSVVQILEVGGREPDIRTIQQKLDNLSSFQRAVLLATCGRGEVAEGDKCALSTFRWPQLNENEATALCANLSSNTTILSLNLSVQKVFGTPKGCTLLADALATNSALRYLYLGDVKMRSGAVRCLINGLYRNKTLISLHLSHNPLLDEGIGFVGEFVRTNFILEDLYLAGTGCGFEGARQMSGAMEHNTTLGYLDFGCNNFGRDGMKKLLEPLSPDVRDPAKSLEDFTNTSLKALDVFCFRAEDFCVESVARMIKTNKTLKTLSISFVPLLPADWTDHLIPALRDNKSLECLLAYKCGGLAGYYVQRDLMNENSFEARLQRICLKRTDMKSWQGKLTAHVGVTLRALPPALPPARKKRPKWRLFRCFRSTWDLLVELSSFGINTL